MQNITLHKPITRLLILSCKTELLPDEVAFIRNTVQEEKEQQYFISIIQLAQQHGILPLLYYTLKTHTSDIISSEQLSTLKSSYTSIAQRNMLMSMELIHIMKLLESAGIEALALKGPTLAQLAYGDITLRQFSDLDILIKPNDLQEAISLLKAHNYTEAYPLTTSQLNSFIRSSHEFTLFNHTNRIAVELHWRLTSEGFLVQVDKLDFFEDTCFVTLNHKNIQTVDLEKLLIYLAVHGAKHYWERLEWLVDIAYIVEKNLNLDWEEIIKMSKKIGAEKILFSTLYLCEALLSTPIPKPVHDHFAKEKTVKKLSKKLFNDFIEDFEHPSHTRIISAVQLELLETRKSKLAYLHTLIKPTQLDYLSIKIPDKLSFLYYFVRPVNILFRWFEKQ